MRGTVTIHFVYFRNMKDLDNCFEVDGNSSMDNDAITQSAYCAKGRRIVDIDHFLQQLRGMSQHGPLGCSFNDMVLVGESQKGLNCGLKFQCSMCHVKQTVWTDRDDPETLGVTTAAVIGITEIGCGFTNLEEFTAALNMPPMSSRAFSREQERLWEAWEAAAAREMEEAVAEEKRLAVEAGHVDGEGCPLITVVADGSWAKRSYRTNYSSLSGAVSKFNSLRSIHSYFLFFL